MNVVEKKGEKERGAEGILWEKSGGEKPPPAGDSDKMQRNLYDGKQTPFQRGSRAHRILEGWGGGGGAYRLEDYGRNGERGKILHVLRSSKSEQDIG